MILQDISRMRWHAGKIESRSVLGIRILATIYIGGLYLLNGPGNRNFCSNDAYTEGIFRKDLIANGWGGGAGNKFFNIKFFSKKIVGR